jgi:hypothetical protein
MASAECLCKAMRLLVAELKARDSTETRAFSDATAGGRDPHRPADAARELSKVDGGRV